MPWHPQQVAGWLVLATFGACSFGVLLPGLGPDVYPVALFVLGSLFFLHVVSHVAALLIDPADPQLRALRDDGASSRKPVPELDKTKHAVTGPSTAGRAISAWRSSTTTASG
jgi:palmitoyltransferase